MKRKILPVVFCAMLLLSACTTPKDETETPLSQGGSADLNIDFEYVSYETSFNWPSAVFENDYYSFSIPADWAVINGDEYGLANGGFFVPPETDLDSFNFGAHIAVEFIDEPYYSEAEMSSYTPEQIRTDFFAMQSIDFSKMGGLTNLDFYVWERDDNSVYITEYQRSNDVLVMDTTAYHVMLPDCYYIVYATTFGEDTEIPVQEAASQLIDTFQRL